MKNSAATLLRMDCYCHYEKILRIMKLSVLFLFLAMLKVSAHSYGQELFNINNPSAVVKKVFREIESQSSLTVFYRTDQVDLDRKVKMDITNGSIEQVMTQLLNGQPLTYKLIDKVIVIKPLQAALPGIDAASQQVEVTGKVTASNTGEGLVGVTVQEKGTNNAVVTNAKGVYSISVKDNNSILEFHYVGYKVKEVVVGKQSSINIVLEEENKTLEQVIVVGYGTQKKKDLTGSVSTISSKELENRSNTQFGYSIEGKAAGVQVIRSSGQPQSGFSIRVRGTSSITSGSDPLYIVDGVPTPNTNDINPADIENITILKDASSSAIYGSSGANGVVLITTKRGKNQKLKLSFNSALTISKAWKKMDVLDSAGFRNLATEMGASTDWAKYNENTNWQDVIFKNALTQNYQLSAAGGTEKTSYYVSGSIINQNGIVLNNSVKRATLKANVDHQLTKHLKIGASLAYDNWKDVDVSENNRNGVITRLFTTIPNIGIRDKDKPEMYARSPFINDLENPVSTVYQPEHLYTNNRYHGNVYAEAEVIKGLKLKSLFGFEQTNGKFTSFQDSVQTKYGSSLGGIAAENKYSYKYWVSENTASYTKKTGDHNIAALGGFIISRELTDNLYKSSHDFSQAKGGDQSVGAGAVQGIPGQYYVRKSHVAFIGRFNYSYKDKYYLTSNFRADGSGQFPVQQQWGYFPSFSAGWRISQEDFFKNVTGINELKLRAGWGIVGNDRAEPYNWYGLVDTLNNKYLFNGNNHTAFIPTTLENKDLRWEKTSQFDIGVDLAFLQNRITFTADYYYKKTSDMLLEVPIPSSAGLPNLGSGVAVALQNAGSLLNKGFEFQVSSKNIVGKNFKWNSDFNISFNRNKVLSIVGNVIHSGAINPAGDDFNTAIVQEGQPLGTFFGKTSLGVDSSTGDIKFLKKADGSEDSVGIIGNANPKYIFGFSNSFTYKNFTLDLFFQGVQGNQVFNATKILTESMSLIMNQSATVANRWRQPGDVTSIPRVTPNDWANSNPSTRYIENGSYVRLKSVTLGYNLPAPALAKLKMSRCLFYFTAENLLTFTKYSGFDPEVSAFSKNDQSARNQNTAPGVDYGTYPQSRDFIFGVNISF